MVLPQCDSDEELEYLARSLEMEITGYFENVVPNLSDSRFKKKFERHCCLVRFKCKNNDAKLQKLVLANMSADATHRFQPFQPSSNPNQPRTVDPNRTQPTLRMRSI